jgi:cytochrome c peroxidase
MHNGAYTTLEGAVRHHLNPTAALWNYDPSQLAPAL